MAVHRHNWIALKAEYLTGDILVPATFLKSKGVPVNNQKIVGWSREKKEYEEKIAQRAIQRTSISEVESLADTRQRQARLARFVQLKGTERLKTLKTEEIDPEQARKMVISGLEQERRALGMEGGGQNLTQININQGPKTNLDRELEEMDYEQTLELIAELKRLKQSRAGRPAGETDGESAGETKEGQVL